MSITQAIAASERIQDRVSWLERIELYCAAEWAASLDGATGQARVVTGDQGEPPSEERDWRRAWIQVHSLRCGTQVQFDYRWPRRAIHGDIVTVLKRDRKGSGR